MSKTPTIDDTIENLRKTARKKVEDIARRANNNPVLLLAVALGELYALEFTLELLLKKLDEMSKKQG